MDKKIYKTTDEYISSFPPAIQKLLNQMRQTIKQNVPAEATEAIAYGMPTFRLNGNLVHFAAFKNHIGFFPTPRGIAAYEKEAAPFQSSKGTLQFPLDKPLPLELVAKITRARVEQNQAKK